MGPAIFTDVSPDSRLAQEEIFGPVLVVMENTGPGRCAGNSEWDTLCAYRREFFQGVQRTSRRLRIISGSAMLYINRKITGALVGRQPFGGFGMSGIGYKAGGPDYLPQFMNAKSVSENTLRRGFAPSGPQDN